MEVANVPFVPHRLDACRSAPFGSDEGNYKFNRNPTGLIMIGVIIASRKIGINPDNVATPIAASLGDLITLSLLSGISTGLYKELGNGDLYLLGCMGPL